MPKSRVLYWKSKFDATVDRDRRNIALLRRQGWGVCVVWECQLRDMTRVMNRVARFLDS